MIFLVDLATHNGVSAGALYVGTDGYTSKPGDSPASRFYSPRLKSAGSIERRIAPVGQASNSVGTLTVINGKPYGGVETIDGWIDLAFQAIVIRSIESLSDSFAQTVTRFIGAADGLVSTRVLSNFDLTLRDRLADLNRPLLKATYAGTTISAGGGIEGNVDLKDRLKPKVWGTKRNAQAVPVNVFDLLYQVSDGPVSSIAAYDGGLALTAAGEYPSIATLVAATLSGGQYATCLTQGVFRLGGSPVFAVTADVVEGATIALRTAGQIASRMVSSFAAAYGESMTADVTTVVTLDAANAAECGIQVVDQETAQQAVGRMLASVGGWILPDPMSSTVFDVGRFAAPSGSPVTSFDLDDHLGGDPEMIATGQGGKGIPSYRVVVRYDQIGVTQTAGDLAGAVSDARRAYLKDEWRQAAVESATVRTQYPRADVLTVDTCLVNVGDAAAEAARLLALHGVRRKAWRVKVPLADADGCDLMDVVTLASRAGRMGLAAGALTTVIGRLDDFSADVPAATLDLWY